MDKIFCFLWILIRTIIPIRAVLFLSSPSSRYVGEGESLTLFCQVNAPLSRCDWLKNNSTTDDPVIISASDHHYRLLGNLTDGTCHLVVTNASHEADTGQWRCRVVTTNNLAVVSEGASLMVLPHELKASRFSKLKPGVVIGGICAGSFFIGGLVVIYCYKSKKPCFLAPSGRPSRSMLIIPSESRREQDRCYDRELSVHLMNEAYKNGRLEAGRA